MDKNLFPMSSVASELTSERMSAVEHASEASSAEQGVGEEKRLVVVKGVEKKEEPH